MRGSRETRCVTSVLTHALFAMALLLYVGQECLCLQAPGFLKSIFVVVGASCTTVYFLMRYLIAEMLPAEHERLTFFSAGGMLMVIFDLGYWVLQCFASWLTLKLLINDIGCCFGKCVIGLVVSSFVIFLGLATCLAFKAVRYDFKHRAFPHDKRAHRTIQSDKCDVCQEESIISVRRRETNRGGRCLTCAMIVHGLIVCVECILWVGAVTAGGRSEWVGGACLVASAIFLLKYQIVFFEPHLRADIGESAWSSGVKESLAVAFDLGYLALQFDIALFALVWVFAGPGSSFNVLAKTAVASVIGACLAFGCYMAYCSVKFDIKYRVFIPNLNRRRIPSRKA